MASETISIVLPTTGTDATGAAVAWAASNYGGAHVFRNGAKIGSVAAPGLTFVDGDAPVGDNVYTATVFNNDAVAGEGPASAPVTATVAPPPVLLPVPGAPTITVAAT